LIPTALKYKDPAGFFSVCSSFKYMEPAVLLLLLLLSKGQENAGRFAEGPRSSGGREGRQSRKMAKKRSKIATTEEAAAAAPPAVGSLSSFHYVLVAMQFYYLAHLLKTDRQPDRV
jgi:hypothetical protein